ncbi:hypothetical protein L2E82_20610 [Cichorium intybus]|uniref:Uncharacterized protein n=1 Tax=Cichorium intybus TaxID=13427 RepID=A0ACB9DU47_CICIN|nr:hypothetical protein L2E82_20610 [Cichorium intybus]
MHGVKPKKTKKDPNPAFTPDRCLRSGSKSSASRSRSKKLFVRHSNSKLYLKPYGLRIKTSPSTMIEAIRSLNEDQREAVIEIGFGALLNMKLGVSSAKLGHFVVANLDDKSLVIKTGKGDIKLTKDVVHDILGLPNGGTDIDDVEEVDETNEIITSWKSQFSKHDISKSELVSKIQESNDDGILFKLNFIALFNSCICKAYKTGYIMKDIVIK